MYVDTQGHAQTKARQCSTSSKQAASVDRKESKSKGASKANARPEAGP